MPDHKHPEDAVELFLSDREPEVAKQTQYNQQGHLKRFTTFCEDEGIDHISDVDGFTLNLFKSWLRKERGISEVTMANYVGTTRAFIKWCSKVELVDDKLFEKMDYPHVSHEEESRDASIDPERVEQILTYLNKYEYGTLRHALFQLIWHTTFRIGTIRALDLDDWKPKASYLSINHRPETGTPLKNKLAGERQVNVNREVANVIKDYVNVYRHDLVDEHGRKPLFTSPSGRAYDSLIRKHINCVTRPCHYTNKCPHDRVIEDCEGNTFDGSSKCPSSISPHPLRRSAITYHLNHDWPQEKLSERASVSVDVLERHYDVRSESEKRQGREDYLDNL